MPTSLILYMSNPPLVLREAGSAWMAPLATDD